jgi:exopolysaccharide biosynthesis protein
VVIAGGKVRTVPAGRDSAIPDGGYVCAIGPEASISRNSFQVGETATLSFSFSSPDKDFSEEDWRGCHFIVGGAPILIHDGEVVVDFSVEEVQQSFVKGRHPRTAVGILPDGTWVLVVVDGRQMNLSLGMSIPELAAFMKSLGCVHALNFDGGGSATMYLYGQVVNSPSDLTGERRISDAILGIPR